MPYHKGYPTLYNRKVRCAGLRQILDFLAHQVRYLSKLKTNLYPRKRDFLGTDYFDHEPQAQQAIVIQPNVRTWRLPREADVMLEEAIGLGGRD